MNSASVGFQCPRCVASGRTTVREPRTAFGATMRSGGGTVTKVLMGVLAAIYVLNLISQNLLLSVLAFSNTAVYAGEFWRLLTYGFTSAGLFGLLTNLLVLWLAGQALEAQLGGWRFLALYIATGLGGATLLFVLGPSSLAALGASSAVVGLLAANAIVKQKGHEDIRPDIGLLVLLVLFNVVVGFSSFGWIGLIGGILVGAIVGAILAYAPRERRTVTQIVGLLGVVLVCLLAVVAKILVF
ncbi:MAG: rhomboid family intramembrane serine protease [Propionibacteriaceae bacterium]